MLGYFTDGRTIYELHVLEISFLGLIKRNKVIDYTVAFNQDDRIFKKHWDKMISESKPLKNDGLTFIDWIVLILLLPIILLIAVFKIFR